MTGKYSGYRMTVIYSGYRTTSEYSGYCMTDKYSGYCMTVIYSGYRMTSEFSIVRVFHMLLCSSRRGMQTLETSTSRSVSSLSSCLCVSRNVDPSDPAQDTVWQRNELASPFWDSNPCSTCIPLSNQVLISGVMQMLLGLVRIPWNCWECAWMFVSQRYCTISKHLPGWNGGAAPLYNILI